MPEETAIFKQRTYQHYGVVVLASFITWVLEFPVHPTHLVKSP